MNTNRERYLFELQRKDPRVDCMDGARATQEQFPGRTKRLQIIQPWPSSPLQLRSAKSFDST